MRFRRWIVLVCVLALVLGAAYFFRHASAERADGHANPGIALAQIKAPQVSLAVATGHATRSALPSHRRVQTAQAAPLPPPGTPLKDTYPELQARADAGDAAAASRLYNDVRTCAAANRLQHVLPHVVPEYIQLQPANGSVRALAITASIMKMAQAQLDFVKRERDFCTGLNTDQLHSFTSVSLRAAQLGDQQALACYLESEYRYMPGLLDHPEWLQEFKDNAVQLANYGMTQGNWGVVVALGSAYLGGTTAKLLNQLIEPDPVKAFELLVLEQLGNTDSRAQNNIGQQIQLTGKQLTPSQRVDAEMRAHDTYAKYFFEHPNDDSKGSATCHDPAIG